MPSVTEKVPILDISLSGLIPYVILCDQLLSLGSLSSFTHVIGWISTPSILWPNDPPLYGQATFYLSVLPLVDTWIVPVFRHYEWWCYGNLCTCFLWTYIFNNFGYMPRNKIAVFNFLRNCQTIFQSYHILHSNQQWIKVPISPYACQHLFIFLFD